MWYIYMMDFEPDAINLTTPVSARCVAEHGGPQIWQCPRPCPARSSHCRRLAPVRHRSRRTL